LISAEAIKAKRMLLPKAVQRKKILREAKPDFRQKCGVISLLKLPVSIEG